MPENSFDECSQHILSVWIPIRLFQQYATIDAVKWTCGNCVVHCQSFPLFGYDLKDYEALFIWSRHAPVSQWISGQNWQQGLDPALLKKFILVQFRTNCQWVATGHVRVNSGRGCQLSMLLIRWQSRYLKAIPTSWGGRSGHMRIKAWKWAFLGLDCWKMAKQAIRLFPSKKLMDAISDLDRFMLHLAWSSMPRSKFETIEFFGTQVAPKNTCLLCYERGL